MRLGDSADLAGMRPSRGQRHAALALLVLSALVFAVLVPSARNRLPAAPAFVAMYQSALVVNDLLTAVLLLGQLQLKRSRRVGVLALGYLFTAQLALVHMLTFPGLFTPGGLLGANDQTTAWLYMFWHGLFPLFVLAYAAVGDAPLPRSFMRAGALGTVVLAGAVLLLATLGAPALPVILAGQDYTEAYRWVVGAVLALTACALAVVSRKRPRSVLDLWLMVVMSTWVCDVALSAVFNAGRFDLGFYAGRLYGLAASLFVLAALALANIQLHLRWRAEQEQALEAQARERSDAMLASVLHQLPQGVLLLDGGGAVLAMNERATALDGADDGQSLVQSVIDGPLREAAGAPFRDRVVERVEAGRKHVYAVHGAAVAAAGGQAPATVVIIDDITERTEAETALRRALYQARYLVENTPLAVIEWDCKFVVRSWNRRAEHLFGWSAAEVVGQRIDRFPVIHPDDARKVAELIGTVAHSSENYFKSENRNRTRDGRTLYCEWYNSALRDDTGELQMVFSLVLDATARRLAMEQLQEADRRKDLYIATLAHELRNPLAPIANAAPLLRSPQLSPARLDWIAGMLERQTAQMARLLDDLLDVSRIGRGKIILDRVCIDLSRLVRDALQTSASQIEAARHELRVALPEAPVWVNADAARITQVLSNLINNAAKYTAPRGLIEVALAADAEHAVLTVSDNGVGIETDMLGRVFEPFVQVSSASHLAQGGLGIGLSLAKGLVELHGGTIAAASLGPGHGSTFTIRLPLAGLGARGAEELAAGDESAAGLHQTILVADDNVDAADSLAWLLRSQGAQVEVAHDGEAALRLFREHPADIALLDLGMPKLSGLEVAEALAHASPRPFLVALTGRGRKEDRVASLEAGFDEHLTKPVAPQRLLELLQRVRAGGV